MLSLSRYRTIVTFFIRFGRCFYLFIFFLLIKSFPRTIMIKRVMLLKRLLYENRTKYFHNFHGPKALSLCEFLKEKKKKKKRNLCDK